MKKILFLMLIMIPFLGIAQTSTISGKVTDTANSPLPGVTVMVKGTQNGTVTTNEGNFTLSNVPANGTVVFSFVGLKTIELPVDGKTTFTVTMEEESIGLDEVVAIGYGTVKKSDLTGAVSVVKSDDMKKSNAGTIGTQLQGLATGVNVRSTGRAGSDAFIEIRGVGTLSNRTPLWIIDGMISTPGAEFNPADVESIQILKDASTAAIYGSRAANGVIIVTTKSGKEGPMKVTFPDGGFWEGEYRNGERVDQAKMRFNDKPSEAPSEGSEAPGKP